MMNSEILGRRHLPWLGLSIAVVGLLATGCGQSRQVVLLQDFAPPSQQRLALTSEVAACLDAGAKQTCVMTFPLPGAHRGPRAFVLYLRVPAGTGTYAAGPDGVKGFLVQEVGDLAGRTAIVDGTVRVKNVWLRPQERVLELDLTCSDDTHVRGTVRVESDGRQVRAIEQEFAADVRRMGEEATE